MKMPHITPGNQQVDKCTPAPESGPHGLSLTPSRLDTFPACLFLPCRCLLQGLQLSHPHLVTGLLLSSTQSLGLFMGLQAPTLPGTGATLDQPVSSTCCRHLYWTESPSPLCGEEQHSLAESIGVPTGDSPLLTVPPYMSY